MKDFDTYEALFITLPVVFIALVIFLLIYSQKRRKVSSLSTICDHSSLSQVYHFCICFVLFLANITQITRDSFRLHLMLLLYLLRRAQVWWIRWAEYKTLKTTLMFLMISSQCWSICRRFRVFGKFTWWKTLQAALTELPCSPTAKLQVHGGFYDSQ